MQCYNKYTEELILKCKDDIKGTNLENCSCGKGKNTPLPNYIKNVEFIESDYKLIFTYTNNTKYEIDLPIENLVKNASYQNNILTITFTNDTVVNIPLTDLIDIYTVENTNTINLELINNKIKANLNESLLNKINVIITNGSGNNYLANDGTYKPIDLSNYAPNTIIGELANLNTTNKSNLVNAINEILNNSSGSGIEIITTNSNIKDLSNGGYIINSNKKMFLTNTYNDYSNCYITSNGSYLLFKSSNVYLVITFHNTIYKDEQVTRVTTINAPSISCGVLGNGYLSKITCVENNSNKVTTISSSSTDEQYPSAKAVYDYVNSVLGN